MDCESLLTLLVETLEYDGTFRISKSVVQNRYLLVSLYHYSLVGPIPQIVSLRGIHTKLWSLFRGHGLHRTHLDFAYINIQLL